MVSLCNTPNDSYSGDEICDSSSSSNDLRRHSIACLPSSSADVCWFHGRMEKYQADQLLMTSTPGSFLVRQQDPSRFYVSLATQDGVKHHPIKRLGSQYFYAGKSYPSLNGLVNLFKERGGEPISASPFESIGSEGKGIRYIATTSFSSQDNRGISVSPGDLLTLVEKSAGCWVLAKNHRTGVTGFVPLQILTPLFDEAEDLSKALYIHSYVLADALNQMRIAHGSFLIRPSSQGQNCWALLVYTREEQVKKILIREAQDEAGGWVLAGRRFRSIAHVIDRYCHYPILDDVRLCHVILSRENLKYGSYSISPDSASCLEDDLKASISSSNDQEMSSKKLAKELDVTNGNNGVLAFTSALRKSKEDKPWKPCYVSLQDEASGCALVIADDPQLNRIRYSYKLPYCIFYNFDDSVFEKDGCLYISYNDMSTPGTYLCIQPFHVFAEWLCYLRPRVLALQLGDLPAFNGFQFKMPEAPKISILRVHLDKFRSDALKSDNVYCAQLTLNGIKICTTPLLSPGKTSSTIVFDSSFIIPFSPSISASLQVSIGVLQKGKNLRPFGISPVVPMPTSDLSTINFETGISLRLARSQISVLSEKEYEPVLEWLETYPISILDCISDNLAPQDRNLFSLAIVCQLYSNPQKLLSFIEALLKSVISNSAPDNVLRQDSLATSVVSQTLRTAARSQLEKVLNERTTVKIADSHDVQAIVNCIVDIARTGTVLDILSIVKRVAEQHYKEPHIVRRVLSTVLILRFANPIILSRNGLANGQAVAKGVQAVANSACSKTTDTEESNHPDALRQLFDGIETFPTQIQSKTQNRPPSYDWLAIFCYLIYSILDSRPKDTIPPIPDKIIRVLLAHKPQN